MSIFLLCIYMVTLILEFFLLSVGSGCFLKPWTAATGTFISKNHKKHLSVKIIKIKIENGLEMVAKGGHELMWSRIDKTPYDTYNGAWLHGNSTIVPEQVQKSKIFWEQYLYEHGPKIRNFIWFHLSPIGNLCLHIISRKFEDQISSWSIYQQIFRLECTIPTKWWISDF